MRIFMVAIPAPWDVIYRHDRSDPHLARSLHMVRDVLSFVFIQWVLTEKLETGSVLFDWPNIFALYGDDDDEDGRNGRGRGARRNGETKKAGNGKSSERLLPFADTNEIASLLGTTDLGVVVTRPAISESPSDRAQGALERTNSPLEKSLHECVRTAFDHVSRSEVRLSSRVKLPQGWTHRQETQFQQRGPCTSRTITRYRGEAFTRVTTSPWADKHEKYGWAAGYTFFHPRWKLPGEGDRYARLLLSFGMDGTTNLLWAALQRAKLSDRLLELVSRDAPALMLGEFSFWLPAERNIASLGFVEHYDFETVTIPL